jgi:hypothetical protein
MNISSCNGTININGVSYRGTNVSINGNILSIDGKVQVQALGTEINVVITGDCDTIEGASEVTVRGNVQGDIKVGSGDVKCGNVAGNVSTGSGDISCGDIMGNIKTSSGDVYRK